MSDLPWDFWYHCMGNTYGTWLPGDPRGFRTRHEREHVDGDYRNPPPKGLYEQRYEHSKELMNRDVVYLTWAQRVRAVEEFVRSFEKWEIELRALSIDRIHLHALIRAPHQNPRHYLGLAKKESSAYMKRDGVGPHGGLWGTKTECKPINNAQHHARVAQYILDHAKKGAAVWELKLDNDCLGFDPDELRVD